MKPFWLALFALLAIHLESPETAYSLDHFKLLDLHIGKERHVGRVLTHNDQLCWLLSRDGRLQQFPINKVTDFSEVSDHFKPYSQVDLKSQLRTEFGAQFEVRTTNHYVVVARRGSAEAFAAIFEEIYREFVRSFRTYGLQVDEPEFPLVAIVFPDQAGFLKYCQQERTQILPGLVGYYLTTSNRVAMYERPNVSEVDDTVIHEATHQIAFNTGVHSRLAKHPRWVVEGLATVFESDGIRHRQSSVPAIDRVNPERYRWFTEYARTRRTPKSLANFVRDDKAFEKSLLDAYSEAWALSFFLIDTRSADYSRYLKQLVARDPLLPYDADARLNDFKAAFGSDLDSLETIYLKYLRRVASR